MKLRIRDNSIRLRLMRTEVDELKDTGVVSASTSFPGGKTFKYRVESSPATVSPAAVLADSEMSIRLPEATVVAWATSDEVSMRGEQPLEDGGELKILVEKDFVCLTGREDEEDETEMYPHPSAGKVSC